MKKRNRRVAPPFQVRIFQCAVCGELAPAAKGRGRTAPGHKKHMYCIKCRDITEHIQIE